MKLAVRILFSQDKATRTFLIELLIENEADIELASSSAAKVILVV